MKVTIVSPERTLYSGTASGVEVPGSLGRFEIQENHAPIISSLTAGNIYIKGDTPETFAIAGGFLEMSGNEVNICVE
ncbi:MAG: hypothetical protein J1F06_04045 [Prevotellaceae bacterium]|nr:hypothetical protein [Prevotellaceae bacterium]